MTNDILHNTFSKITARYIKTLRNLDCTNQAQVKLSFNVTGRAWCIWSVRMLHSRPFLLLTVNTITPPASFSWRYNVIFLDRANFVFSWSYFLMPVAYLWSTYPQMESSLDNLGENALLYNISNHWVTQRKILLKSSLTTADMAKLLNKNPFRL